MSQSQGIREVGYFDCAGGGQVVVGGAELPNVVGGLGIYDVEDPHQPREITFWACPGTGIHRFTFDGRYAYLSPCMEGYRNNIVVILDLADPAKPQEVGRWWMPGQWIAGGEEPGWTIRGPREPRCH